MLLYGESLHAMRRRLGLLRAGAMCGSKRKVGAEDLLLAERHDVHRLHVQ
jgi:hypothetical protein